MSLELWIEEMRTTDKPQANGVLCHLNEKGGRSYCCLGLGSEMVPHMQIVVEGDEVCFGASSLTGLAPSEFINWLGLPIPERRQDSDEFDVIPDWPVGLTQQGRKSSVLHEGNTDRTAGVDYNGNEVGNYKVTAAVMNDAGFTFKQIADVFAYFGARVA